MVCAEVRVGYRANDPAGRRPSAPSRHPDSGVWGCSSTSFRSTSEGEGTLLELRARTEWPRGRELLGKLIEVVILNPFEARTELARLKTLVERGMKAA